MHLYKLAVLLIFNIVFVQAWYTTVVENGTTIVRTKSRSRSSTATSSPTATTSSTTTTTSAVSSPTYTLYFYDSSDCSGDVIHSSMNDGCFNYDFTVQPFSFDSTSSGKLSVDFYPEASCAGNPLAEIRFYPNTCAVYNFDDGQNYMSYTVTTKSQIFY